MTLRELERWIAWEIAGNYHQRVHSALNRPPIAVWREHEDKVGLRLPVDRLQFWVSFLPEEERNLRRDGVHFCNIRYWSDALAADVGHSNEKLLINVVRGICRAYLSADRRDGSSKRGTVT